VELAEYKQHLDHLAFGKRLPGAVYVLREENSTFGAPLDSLLQRLLAKYQISPAFNVLKFRTDELKISFLSYPDFFTDPHSPLCHAITVDLVTGRARHTDYADNSNPPILHRKESFLPPDHPRRPEFEALTNAEEAAGLYENTTTIGFKLNWERLLAKKDLRIERYTLNQGPTRMGRQP
jgi:DNA phosphorothioation-associated putative methyltransferase